MIVVDCCHGHRSRDQDHDCDNRVYDDFYQQKRFQIFFLIQTCQAKRPEDIVNHCLSAREYRVGVDMVGRD